MPEKVSEKPWSNYSASDYSPEQWHAACLIHQHEGAPTSKDQCKLPVKTPDGTLNRGGVKAAAGALAGARGGVSASSQEKATAAKALLRYYSQLDMEPPESLQHDMVDDFLAHFGVKKEEAMSQQDVIDDFLAHYGIKGMRWGIRRPDKADGTVSGGKKSSGDKADDDDDDSSSSSGSGLSRKERKLAEAGKDEHVSVDAERFIKTMQKDGTHQMSDREIKEAVNRAKMVDEYNKIFGPQPNKELKAQVDTLDLQKRYGELNAKVNPSTRAKVAGLVASSAAAYLSYKQLDKATGGSLSKSVNQNLNQLMGKGVGGKHRKGLPIP